MTREQSDPVIDEVREVRQRISARFGHDPARLVSYYMELQERHRDRLIDRPKAPDSEQDAIAALILDELADDRRWDEAFAGSQDRLAEFAAKVRRDIAGGRDRDVGIDEL